MAGNNVRCLTCEWAKYAGSMIFSCPFIEGSCAKMPETLEAPDIDAVRAPKIAPPEPEPNLLPMVRPQDYPYRFTFGGETHTLREWSEFYGVLLSTLQVRMSTGWDIGAALERGREESRKRERTDGNEDGL